MQTRSQPFPNSNNPTPELYQDGDYDTTNDKSINSMNNINNYLPPQYQRQYQTEQTLKQVQKKVLELKVPPRLSFIIGSENSNQMLLVPMFDGKDCLRDDLGNLGGPKDKNWDCIRCFWVVENKDSEGVKVL